MTEEERIKIEFMKQRGDENTTSLCWRKEFVLFIIFSKTSTTWISPFIPRSS
jgi:hypothetical protein